ITMLPVTTGGAAAYSLAMFAAGAFLLYHTVKLATSASRVLASRVVHASVIYLPVILGIMMAAKA
ncbi:MAG: hypothetical protein WA637_20070, partial [Terriglobales bacterium]